jgi:hypothetical protein
MIGDLTTGGLVTTADLALTTGGLVTAADLAPGETRSIR